MPVVVEDRQLLAVGVAHRVDRGDHVPQLLRARGLGGEDGPLRGQQLVVEAHDDLAHQGRLRAEVRVQAAGEQADGVGDVAHRRVAVAALGDQAGADLEDLVAP